MPESSTAETAKDEDRVQFDCVRRDAGLAVGEVEEGDSGNARARAQSRTWFRATRICWRRYGVAWRSRLGEGASVIMWLPPDWRTTWRSESASARTSTTAAITVKTRCSNGSRVAGKFDGAGRVMRKWTVVVRAGRRCGRSWSVFTAHRSPPQALRFQVGQVPFDPFQRLRDLFGLILPIALDEGRCDRGRQSADGCRIHALSRHRPARRRARSQHPRL